MALTTESKESAYVIFVSYDCGSGFPTAVALTEKTPTKYLTSSLEQFIARLHGNGEVTVRCDNEPALRQLVDKMAERRVGKTNWTAHRECRRNRRAALRIASSHCRESSER
eukprot:3965986-Amphidinium_carterae.2